MILNLQKQLKKVLRVYKTYDKIKIEFLKGGTSSE